MMNPEDAFHEEAAEHRAGPEHAIPWECADAICLLIPAFPLCPAEIFSFAGVVNEHVAEGQG